MIPHFYFFSCLQLFQLKTSVPSTPDARTQLPHYFFVLQVTSLPHQQCDIADCKEKVSFYLIPFSIQYPDRI